MTFVPMCSVTDPSTEARKSGASNAPFRKAIAPAAATGVTALLAEGHAPRGGRLPRPVRDRGPDRELRLVLVLNDGLEERELHTGRAVLVGARGDLVDGAAEDERVEGLVGDELTRAVILLRA